MDKKYIDKPGKYICTVKEPGNGWIDQPEGKVPFIRIPCIVDMPDNEMHGHESVWYGYLGSKVSEKTGKTSRQTTEEKLNEVFGWSGNWDDESSLDSFIGRKVRLQCDESDWQGKQQVKARWLNPFTTKSDKNKEEYRSKRKAILEQLKKDYPILGQKVEKTHDEDNEIIPF
jgi:hypothetical protein